MISDPRLRVPLVVLTALIIELTLLTRVRVLGVMPNLMLLLAVAAGIVGGPVRGAAVGFGSGMAVDLFLQTPLGLSALVYSMVGYAVGTAQTGILRSSWWIPVLTAFVASAGGELAFALTASVLGDTSLVTARLGLVIVLVGAMNALLAPVTVRTMGWALDRAPARGGFVV
ncbi:MAG: rod shape-determining protein MreD [Acidimicrobiales bacterium]